MMDYRAARQAMVEGQVRPSDVTRSALIEAMADAPRELFAPPAARPVAYADAPTPLGGDRYMLEPRAIAKLIDALDPRSGDLMLAVGAGTGYGAAIASRLAATVVALEENPELAAKASELLADHSSGAALVETGPLPDGAPDAAPFDVIMIEGGIAVEPRTLLGQLRDGGRLAAIWMTGGGLGYCRIWTRIGDTFSARRGFDATAAILPGFAPAPAFTF